METLVINYLEKNYTLGEKTGLDGITKIKVINYYNKIIYWDDLENQLNTIFGLNEETIKLYVGKWAWNKGIDLLKYWDLKFNPFDGIVFPSISRVASRTIAMDLVSVQPMSMPKFKLNYFDYKYNEPWYIKLKNKIIRFYFDVKEKISTFVNKVRYVKRY
jgi:hypothetical protein